MNYNLRQKSVAEKALNCAYIYGIDGETWRIKMNVWHKFFSHNQTHYVFVSSLECGIFCCKIISLKQVNSFAHKSVTVAIDGNKSRMFLDEPFEGRGATVIISSHIEDIEGLSKRLCFLSEFNCEVGNVVDFEQTLNNFFSLLNFN